MPVWAFRSTSTTANRFCPASLSWAAKARYLPWKPPWKLVNSDSSKTARSSPLSSRS